MNPVDLYERVTSLQELKECLEGLGGVEGSNVELKSVHLDLNDDNVSQ